MREAEYRKDQVVKYLIWTFAPAYIVQICAALLYSRSRTLGQLLIAAMMFVPALGAVIAGADVKSMGWRPRIRKNIGTILIAWFAPAVLTAAGAALYFMIFPDHFDLSGGYLSSVVGAEALGQLREQGISYPMYVLVSFIGGITYAPPINMLTALGEEIGWRGFLYPQLRARFGRCKGWLLGGFIWGVWHWPLIWLIGYEYGEAAGNPSGYIGFPVTGMLLFCVITAGLGIIHDRLYEKSGSIWVTALFHGAFNAAATLPLAVCLADTGSARLLGPASNGIIAGLPLLAAAVIILLRSGGKKAPECPSEKRDNAPGENR